MARIPSRDLAAYVVWLPVLRAGNVERAAHREGRRIPDERAMRFYDADAKLGKLYSEILPLARGIPAWDVYFLFAPGVRWDGRPPAPTYWMHQLGRSAPRELRFDGNQLAREVEGLLGAIPSAATTLPTPHKAKPTKGKRLPNYRRGEYCPRTLAEAHLP